MVHIVRRFAIACAILTLSAQGVLATPSPGGRSVRALFLSNRIIVVAHRGCHNPAPRHGLGTTPENSRAALEHCVQLGVDIMETDVHRTADGELVMIHDDTVDRTTTGSGRVDHLTLAALRQLRLRDNLGGATASATDQQMLTLAEILEAARGRIFLNLDIKDAIYPEVIAAVEKAGMADQVIIKTSAGPSTPPLASMAPFDRIPFMPILLNADGHADLAAIAARQAEGTVRPLGFELPTMSANQLEPVAVVSKTAHVPLWMNTLLEGFIPEWGGDVQALRDPKAVWGRMIAKGITIFQTDEPEALIAFRDKR